MTRTSSAGSSRDLGRFRGNVESVNTDWIPLEPGEPIGVVALSGPVDADKLDAGLTGHSRLGASRYRSLEPSPRGRLSRRAETRIGWPASKRSSRAGPASSLRPGADMGSSRLLGLVDWGELSKRGICMVGFSDLTAILNPLSRGGIVADPRPDGRFGARFPATTRDGCIRCSLASSKASRFSESRKPPLVRPGCAGGTGAGRKPDGPGHPHRDPLGTRLRWQHPLPRRGQ